MSYSGIKTLYLQSQFQRNMLATLCRGLGTGLSRGYATHNVQNHHHGNEPYYKWLGRELAIRAVYCGWVSRTLSLSSFRALLTSIQAFRLPVEFEL